MANWWESGSATGASAIPNGTSPGANNPRDADCPPGERRKPTQDGWGDCEPTGEPTPSEPAPAACPPDKPHMYEGYCQKCPPGEWNHNNVCEPIGSPSPDKAPETTPQSPYTPPSAPKPTKSPYDAEMSKLLFEQLQAMIRGEGQPFSPEVVAKMNAGLLGSNKAQLETSQRDLQKRLIASGLSRSGVAPAEQGRLRSRADASLSDGFRQTAITAIQGNYAAKAQALAQAQTFLNSERANALSTDQLTFGYAQLSQQWKALQAQFEQQKWLANNGNEQDLLRLLLQLQNGGL